MNDGAKGRAKGRLATLCNVFAKGSMRYLVMLATTTDTWTISLFSLLLLFPPLFFVTARFYCFCRSSFLFFFFYFGSLEMGYLL